MRADVNIALVGAGLIGLRHAAAIDLVNGLSLCAIVDPSPDAAALAKTRNIPIFPSLDRLFAAQRPDGIILATPTPLHGAQGLECIAQGCPVLIEKPLAVSVTEGVALVQASERAQVPVLVGHHRRHNPMIQVAHDVIASGRIGSVRAFQATCWFYKPDTYFEAAPWRTKTGAGPISVNLIHDVDLMRYLCGDVISVQAQAAPSLRGFETEDLAAAVLRCDTGAIGTITVSDSIAAPWSWELTAQENPAYPAVPESCYMIGGSLGSMSLPDLRVWSHDGAKPDWWSPMSASSLIRDMDDPLVVQLRHFVDVIQGQVAPLVSAREGLKSLEVVEAIQKSSKSGGTVLIEST